MTVMMRSMLEVADNSGARKLQMILPLGGSTGLRAGLGDVVTASARWRRKYCKGFQSFAAFNREVRKEGWHWKRFFCYGNIYNYVTQAG